MSTFDKNFTYGVIKEVGEDDILVNAADKDIEIPLTEENKKAVYDAVEEGIFIVPVDVENKKILMNVDTKAKYEVFPETDLKEIINADETDE